MYRQNSLTFPLKKKRLSHGPSLKRTTDIKSRPYRGQIHTNLTSLLRTLQGPGVDNLRYAPFPVITDFFNSYISTAGRFFMLL